MSENKLANFFKSSREPIVISLIAGLTLLVYWQVTGFDFVYFDDNRYIFENPAVLQGINRDSVYWAFSTFYFSNWHPLTWLSYMLDISVFGVSAGALHTTNLIIHLINTSVAFAVFHKFTRSFWKSALVAALFAVHPAHIESVAWIAERKDVLSTLFWLLTMYAYVVYAENAKQSEEKPGGTKFNGAYILVVVFFTLGLMAKPMLVTLPFVLLLLDYWTLERLTKWRDLIPLSVEKAPLFALSIGSAILTVVAQKAGGAIQTLEALPLSSRLPNAIISYAKYLVMFVYPVNLSVWYPYDQSLPLWQIGGAVILMAGITALCIHQIKTRKYLLMGWLWFLGTLVPVIGLIQVGQQSHADRYTYVPYFGLFIIIVWGGGEIIQKFTPSKYAAPAAAIVIVLGLSALTFRQIPIWQNSETLFAHSISVTEKNYVLTQNYCYVLELENRLSEAEKQCRDSISYNPEYYEAYNSLGTVQMKNQQFAQAEESFKKAVELKPNYSEVYVNIASAQMSQGKPDEAETNLRLAASQMDYRQNPQFWISAIFNLAKTFGAQEKHDKAIENYERVLQIAPNQIEIRGAYALSLYQWKKYAEAGKQLETILQQNPNVPEVLNLYGLTLLEQNRNAEARKAFEKAVELRPDFDEAKKNLERVKEVE